MAELIPSRGPHVGVFGADGVALGGVPLVDGEARYHCNARSGAVAVDGFLGAVAEYIILVVGFQLQDRGAVGVGIFGPLLGLR